MKSIIALAIFILSQFLCYSQTIVKLSKKDNVYFVPCKVNGVGLNFIFDTGASDVLISKEIADSLQKQGKIKKSDFLFETQKYQTASGDIIENQIIYLREVQIGGLILTDVKASVSSTTKAPLLLGQSALSKFGEFTFNYTSNNLIINSSVIVDVKKQLEGFKKNMKENGLNFQGGDAYLQSVIKNENEKREINNLVDFEIVNVLEENTEDGKILTFRYDITNNSNFDYTFAPLGFNYIFIDVFTDDGKVYSDKEIMNDVLSKKTIGGAAISVNIRNNKAKYFRIYPVSKPSLNY